MFLLNYTYDIQYSMSKKNKHKDYINDIKNYLKENDLYTIELELTIKLLSDNITIYNRVNETLKNTELLNEYGKPTPLLVKHKDLTTTILKLSKELILSIPYTKLKSKGIEGDDMSTEEFVKQLMG